jgi:acyl carrier protein
MTDISPSAVADALEAFIRDRFEVASGDSHFGPHTHLWDDGYVDSLGFTELVAFLEATFRIHIPDDELFSDGFTTIDGISCLTARLAQE